MSNFIPSEIKRIVPRDPSWITKPLKAMLNRKNRFFINYKRHGYKPEDKIRLDNFRKECQDAVEIAKLTYLTNMGNRLNNPNTSQKSCWKIINKVMNKCKALRIPPLRLNNTFILNCKQKAKLFTEFFSFLIVNKRLNCLLNSFHCNVNLFVMTVLCQILIT